MTTDWTSAPPAVHDLAADLERVGFKIAIERGGGSVNRLIEFAGPGCSVRVSADRGQWWIEIGRSPEVGWFDPDVWTACLDDVPISREPSSLAEQADFVRQRWTAVAAAASDVAECLNRKRATRARERLGLPPTAPHETE